MKLKLNNWLISNDVNASFIDIMNINIHVYMASFVAEAYISTALIRRLLVFYYIQLTNECSGSQLCAC